MKWCTTRKNKTILENPGVYLLLYIGVNFCQKKILFCIIYEFIWLQQNLENNISTAKEETKISWILLNRILIKHVNHKYNQSNLNCYAPYQLLFSLTKVQCFGCSPFDWNLFHSVWNYVFLFFSRHSKIRNLNNISVTWKAYILNTILKLKISAWNKPTKQLRAAKSRCIQFLDSKYLIPAAVSKHIFISWLSVSVVAFFRKNVRSDPPVNVKF